MSEDKKPTPIPDPDRFREGVKEDRSSVRDDRTPTHTPERKIHDVVDTAEPPDPISPAEPIQKK